MYTQGGYSSLLPEVPAVVREDAPLLLDEDEDEDKDKEDNKS